MRTYKHLERYLNELEVDIYPQPEDEGHSAWTEEVIDQWIPKLVGCKSVIDLGCGEGFAQPMFEKYGIDYYGVTLGRDFGIGKTKGRNLFLQDFSFLQWEHDSFDLGFARHSLEHSPMPILTLMEWHRVIRQWLCVILPKPEYWLFAGRNHYGIMPLKQARFMLERSGWKIIAEDHFSKEEYRFLCEKVDRMDYVEDAGYIKKSDAKDYDEVGVKE
jgi:SAM-dependent methyltransferase